MIAFVALLFLIIQSVVGNNQPLVKTQQGSVIGTEMLNNVNNQTFYGFLNIPYARAPVGDERFTDSKEPLPWEGIRDATMEGNPCLSINPIFQNVQGDEDCLNLNIFIHKIPQGHETLKSVMVWIHGGAFHLGSNSPSYFGPDFLMLEDIVLVTINYRLNVLGFLSLQNQEVPGNAGLKDQIMALKWIKKNIKAFGGDPDNITIFGESAGAASVQYLLMTPNTKELFHRAIAQSGSALNPWASTNYALDAALKLGEVFDCKTENTTELVKCLRRVKPIDLVKYQYNILSPILSEDFKFVFFLPCVEPKESTNPILTEEPRKLLEEGKFNDVPLIIGTTEMETMFLQKVLEAADISEKVINSLYNNMNKNPEHLLTNKLDSVRPSSRKRVGEEIKQFYFQNATISVDTMVNIINVTTDLQFLLGIHDTINYHKNHSKSPIFHYHFTLETDYGSIKKYLGISIKGTSHGDDIGYLFYLSLFPQNLAPENPGFKGMLKIIKLWTNFAKYGTPTPDSELGIEWKPVTAENRYYLEIGEELKLKENVEKDRMEFWDNIRLKENINDL